MERFPSVSRRVARPWTLLTVDRHVVCGYAVSIRVKLEDPRRHWRDAVSLIVKQGVDDCPACVFVRVHRHVARTPVASNHLDVPAAALGEALTVAAVHPFPVDVLILLVVTLVPGGRRTRITIHSLRSAAISLYAARGLTMLETATVMGQADPGVTWKHYARLFDRSDVEARVRAAQASLDT